MNFDQVLVTHVGSCGRYQKFLVLLLSLFSAIICLYTSEIIFSAGHMKHWCKVPQSQDGPNANISKEEWLNLTVPWVNTKGHWERDECQVYTSNASVINETFDTNDTSPITAQCSGYEYDTSVFKSTIVNEWDIVCDKSYYISFIKSLNIAAMGIGYIIGGIISDKMGRKKTLIGSVSVIAAGRLAITFSPNLSVFLVGNFITHLADVILYASAFTLSLELVGPSWRAVVGALCCMTYAIAYIILSGIAYLCRDRQTLHLATTLPLILAVPIIWLAPESPRWLLDTGKLEEATKVLSMMTRQNGRAWPDQTELDACNMDESEEKEKKVSCVKSVGKILTSRILIVGVSINAFAWFTANMAYFGLTMNIQSLAGSIYVNLAIAGALEFVSTIIGPLMISSCLGRRLATSSLYLLSGLSLLLVLAVPDDMKMVSTGLALFGRGCCSAYFSIIFIWTAELFPTTLRVTAIGLSSVVGKIGGILAPFLAELSTLSEVLPMIILGGLSIGAGLLLLSLPETKGVPLPRTVDDMLKDQPGKAKMCGVHGCSK